MTVGNGHATTQCKPVRDVIDSADLSCYRGKVIAITGASGYIASGIIHALAGIDCRVLRMSRSALADEPTGRATIESMVGDYVSEATWDRIVDIADIVFHFAAQTNLATAAKDPIADFEANVLPLLRLAEACRKRGRAVGVVFAGTVTEAGITPAEPVNESYPDSPCTIYDIHKLFSEIYLEHYQREGMLGGVTLRLSNVYGAGFVAEGAGRGVLNRVVEAAVAGKDISVYGDGSCLRDFIHVDDVVRAFLFAAGALEAVSGRHFVVASGTSRSLLDAFTTVSRRVAMKTGREVRVVHVDPPKGLPDIEFRDFVADTAAFRKATGWRPTLSFEGGIDRTVDAVLDRGAVN